MTFDLQFACLYFSSLGYWPVTSHPLLGGAGDQTWTQARPGAPAVTPIASWLAGYFVSLIVAVTSIQGFTLYPQARLDLPMLGYIQTCGAALCQTPEC